MDPPFCCVNDVALSNETLDPFNVLKVFIVYCFLLRALCWALIFILGIRFLPGCLETILKITSPQNWHYHWHTNLRSSSGIFVEFAKSSLAQIRHYQKTSMTYLDLEELTRLNDNFVPYPSIHRSSLLFSVCSSVLSNPNYLCFHRSILIAV